MRRIIRTALVVLAGVMLVGSLAEAAPKKAVRHRPRHSSRVSSATISPTKKHTVRKHRTAKRTTAAARTTKPR